MNNAKVLVTFNGDTKNLDDATGKAKKGLGSFKGFAKGIGASIAGIAAAAAATATAMLVDITKQSLKARADLEQNLGGVETLFGKDADKVVANAKKAYQTAGVSANEYMQGVTSFSASLLQSLGGDTSKAADIADMAFRDMSDNANKFGSSMESIQNAYQGFAKQNYTMLDNLKLGYGGTKTEMQRLLSDAQKLTGVKYDINNLSDVYNAIHAIQDNLGVTGTTAKEATETITGSVNSAKAAWQNFLSGTIDIKDLVDAVITAAKNIEKELIKIIPYLAQGLVDLINGLIPFIPNLIKQILPVLIQGILSLTTEIIAMLPTLIEMFLDMTLQLIIAIAQALPSMIPQIVDAIMGVIPILIDNAPLFMEAGFQLLMGLVVGIIKSIPKLIAAIPKVVKSLLNAFASLLGIHSPSTVFANFGKNLILGLINGIKSLLSRVVDVAKNLGKKIINGVKNIINPSALLNAGKNLVQGLWNGIKNAKDWVLDKIKGFGSSIINGIKGIFGIASPSKVMFEIGGYLDKGFINGIDSMKTDIEKAINGTFSLSPNVTNAASTNFSPSINVINNIEMKQDPLGQMVNQIKTFSGGAKNDYNYGKA